MSEYRYYKWGKYTKSGTYIPYRKKHYTPRKINSTLQLENGITITEAVNKRLRKIAQFDVRKVDNYEAQGRLAGLSIILTIIPSIIVGWQLLDRGYWWALPIFFISWPIYLLLEPSQERRIAWESKVSARIDELAKIRLQIIEERQTFYNSPEWRLIRSKVIKIHGRKCTDCGNIILNLDDVTVDHILPKSKYPDRALELENLRVLCRSCNSSKGNKDWLEWLDYQEKKRR